MIDIEKDPLSALKNIYVLDKTIQKEILSKGDNKVKDKDSYSSEQAEKDRFKKFCDEICNEYARFLKEKNESYGNSALNPIRIFSKADSLEQIKVRIDDKLNRLKNGNEFIGDDTIKDLTEYLSIRESLFLKNRGIQTHCSEKDLLAYYLMNNREFSQGCFSG